MTRLDPVVLAFGTRRITGQSVLHPQSVEPVETAGQHLVDVGLMSGVEDDRVVGRIEHSVQRQCEFDDTEIRPQVPTRGGDFVDEELTDFGGQLGELFLGKSLQIGWTADLSSINSVYAPSVALSGICPVSWRPRALATTVR